jgi:hypothetical protein
VVSSLRACVRVTIGACELVWRALVVCGLIPCARVVCARVRLYVCVRACTCCDARCVWLDSVRSRARARAFPG